MLGNLITWAIFGLIAGGIARLFVPAREPLGCLGTIGLGIVGSVVGGTLGTLFEFGSVGGLYTGGLISSILGAMLVLLLVRR
jgi:uncharacterized membrane protein YeaQ/YmgE (transglycosylase-associated protein family)